MNDSLQRRENSAILTKSWGVDYVTGTRCDNMIARKGTTLPLYIDPSKLKKMLQEFIRENT